jgi:hypothetical protein
MSAPIHKEIKKIRKIKEIKEINEIKKIKKIKKIKENTTNEENDWMKAPPVLVPAFGRVGEMIFAPYNEDNERLYLAQISKMPKGRTYIEIEWADGDTVYTSKRLTDVYHATDHEAMKALTKMKFTPKRIEKTLNKMKENAEKTPRTNIVKLEEGVTTLEQQGTTLEEGKMAIVKLEEGPTRSTTRKVKEVKPLRMDTTSRSYTSSMLPKKPSRYRNRWIRASKEDAMPKSSKEHPIPKEFARFLVRTTLQKQGKLKKQGKLELPTRQLSTSSVMSTMSTCTDGSGDILIERDPITQKEMMLQCVGM